MIKTKSNVLALAFLYFFYTQLALAASEHSTSGNDQPKSTSKASSIDEKAELTNQLLDVTGIKVFLEELPNGVIENALRSIENYPNSDSEKSDIVLTINVAYPKDSFINQATDSLNKSYDAARFKRIIDLFSTPIAKKAILLESQKPDPNELSQFVSQLTKQPITPNRLRLIKKLDSLAGVSDVWSRASLTTIETLGLAVADGCPDVQTSIRQGIAKQKDQIVKFTRANMEIMLAFTYRELSDRDLSSYIDLYEKSDSTWLQKVINNVILDQFKASAEIMGNGFSKMAAAKRANQSMFTPKCGDRRPAEAAVNQSRPDPVKHIAKSIPRKNSDARNCLGMTTDRDIISCSSKYY